MPCPQQGDIGKKLKTPGFQNCLARYVGKYEFYLVQLTNLILRLKVNSMSCQDSSIFIYLELDTEKFVDVLRSHFIFCLFLH